MLDKKLYREDLKNVIDTPLPWGNLDSCKILITGANGMIASFFVDCLMYRNNIHNSGIQIYALCRNRAKAQSRFSRYWDNHNFHLIIQDVCDSPRFTIRFDYIIHAASNAHPSAYIETPVETMTANLLGCINLLDYAKQYKPKRLLFISSGDIYGTIDTVGSRGLKEEESGIIDCADFRSSYRESKRATETLCASYCKQYGVNVTIARPWYIYGATMLDESTKADVQFLKDAICKRNILMKSAGLQLRSYCYISDMVSALLFILLLGEKGEVYNIADKNCAVTIREFAETLAEIAGVQVVFENQMDREISEYPKIENRTLDASKLEKLGWQAQVGLREGLERIIFLLYDCLNGVHNPF